MFMSPLATLFALFALSQLQLPAPRGYINDFAEVIPADRESRIDRLVAEVRERSGGEIAVVTLADVGDRQASDVALQIGREWRVGQNAAIGDRARNAGVIVLVVPKETNSDGRGRCRVEAGQGAEGFITDGEAASFCREATSLFQQQDYGAAMELVVARVAESYAREFGFALDSAAPAAPRYERRPDPTSRGRSLGINPIVAIVLFFVLLSVLGSFGRRRRGGCGGCVPLIIPFPGSFGGGYGGGSWGGGGWGGGGSWGGGGGGFGGFGGGGGFSGGGGGSDW